MAGLTAALAQARFYLPDNPVPITFQTYGVLLTGGVLGLRWGLASAVLYYLVGMAGLPVFQNGGNGWQYVAHGVTGGYLLGFILATAVTGFLSERGLNRGNSLWAMTISALLVYGPGLIWLAVFDFGWPAEGNLFSSGMYPFIPGDVVKLLFAALSVGILWSVADSRARSRAANESDEGVNTER
jgi:biotin transport system substrate-specific component